MSSLPIPIARPPWTQIGRQLESQVRRAIYTYDLLPLEGSYRVGIALSGGKDSLALLFLLHAISGYGLANLELSALHVEGAYSCGAGVSIPYLKGICQQLKIPLILKRSEQQLESLECYSCSRERRKLLFQAATEVGAHCVAFGHHRDDNVQTFLLNALHKATPAGMLPKVPMHHYGVTIIRPLILCSEQQIIQFAQHHDFRRITCQCPVGQTSKRRRVEELLQQVELLFPHARHNLSQIILNWGDQGALQP